MCRTTGVVLGLIAVAFAQTGCTARAVRVVPQPAGATVPADPAAAKEAPAPPPKPERPPEPRPEPPTVHATVLDSFDQKFEWRTEKDWSDEAAVAPAPRNVVMDVRYKLGKRNKVVISRGLEEPADLSTCSAVLADIDSKLPVGCLAAVALSMGKHDEEYVEGPPIFVRPGMNRAVAFRLDVPNFKSAESEWKYCRPVGDVSAVKKIYLVIYPIVDGHIQIDNLRLVKPASPNTPEPADE